MATNGFSLGTAWIEISPSMRGLRRSVEQELGGVDAGRAMRGVASSVTSTLGDAFKTVTTAGMAGIGTLGAAVVGLAASGGIARALSIENAEAKLTGLGHSAESVTAIMGDALKSVKGTAFGLGDAATVAASLVASGVKSGAELEGVLKTVADTAQISGRSMTDIGLIFGSVAARGKLQGDDMLQLMSSGIPVLQFLSQQLGVTSADVSDMVSKGQVDFATFATAMEAGLGGAAQSAGETFEGAWANVKAALSRGGAQFITPAMDGLRTLFNALIPTIDAVVASLDPLADGLGVQVAGAADVLAAALVPVATGVESLKTLLMTGDFTGGLFGFEEDSGLVDFLFQLRDVAEPAMSSLLPAVGGLVGVLGPLLGQLPLVGQLFGALSGPVGLVIGLVAQVLVQSSTLREAIGGLFAALGPVFIQVGGVLLLVAGQVADLAGVFGDTLGVALAQATPLLSQVLGVLVPLAGGILIGVLSGVTSALGFVADNFATIGPVVGLALAAFLGFKVVTGVMAAVTAVMGAYRTAVGLAALAQSGYTAATYGSVGATYAATGATTAQRLSILAGAAAQKIATAAQWAWNLALSANPIMLVILAIGALVGALVWFFTQTELGKEIWANVTQFFVDAWNNVVAFFEPAWNAIVDIFTTALNWIMDLFFTWHPLGIIIANWDAIVAWFSGFWDGLVHGFTAGINAVVGVFQWLYQGVKPVLDVIGAVISWLWEVVLAVAVISIKAAIWAIGEVFTWLWENIIQPTFALIGAIFDWIYNNVIMPVVDGIVLYFKMWGAIFTWLYENVVKPTFDAIGAVFNWIYTNVVTPVVNGIVYYFQFLGTIVQWLYTNVVQPTFNAIGAVFTWLYENIIKPVWTGIQTAIQVVADWITGTLWPGIQTTLGYMGAGFELLKSTITTVWENIKTAAMTPVKFIVESVYRDGIKATFDSIAESVGIKERLPAPPKLAFASGGVLPGYTPGRDVHDFWSPTGGRLLLSGGEGIIRPDALRALGGKGWLDAVNGARSRAGQFAFADGGIWDAVGGTVAGAGNWLAGVADKVAQIVADPASAIDKLIREPVETLLNGLGGGKFGDMFSSVPLTMVDKLSEWFKTLIAPTTQGANGNWVGGNTLNRLLPYIAQTGTIITDTYRDPAYNAAVGGSPSSYHMDRNNPAVDVSGSNAAMWAFYRLVAADPGGWRQILWQVAGHYDHVHIAREGGVFGDLPTFDSGGWMMPGLAINRSQEPEAVFTGSQWSTLEKNIGQGRWPETVTLVLSDGEEFPAYVDRRAAGVAVRALEEVR